MKRALPEVAPNGRCFALLDLRQRIGCFIAAAVLPGRWSTRAEVVAEQERLGGWTRAAVVLLDQPHAEEVQ